VRLELGCCLGVLEGLLVVAAVAENEGEVAVSFGVIRTEGDGLPPVREGFVGAAQGVQHVGEIVVRFHEVRAGVQSLAKGFCGLDGASHGLEGDAQVEQKTWLAGFESEGAVDVLQSEIVAAAVAGDETEQVPGIGVVGVVIEG
jgi:hypothetical protein